MSTILLRKTNTNNNSKPHKISTDTIYYYTPALMSATSHTLKTPKKQNIFVLKEPVKPFINISIDKEGHPDQEVVMIGNQYDHYVTWIHFNLDELLWQIVSPYDPESEIGYSTEYYYSLYDFQLAFYNPYTKEDFCWSFDGRDFKIPHLITRNPGKYDISLIIQERHGDKHPGNINDDKKTETFISHKWRGIVQASIYDPNIHKEYYNVPVNSDTDRGLIKPPLYMTLSDDGYVTVNNEVLGMYNDSLIRYCCLEPKDYTAHLKNFNFYICFSLNNEFFATSKFNFIQDKKHPNGTIAAWIPDEVYNHIGRWKCVIMAVTDAYVTDDEKDPHYTENFYRFISNTFSLRVERNFVTDEMLTQEPTYSFYDSTFTSADESVFITADNSILESNNNGN